MPVSFPTNPSVGDIYTFNGMSWMWNGTAWVNANTGTDFVPLSGGAMQGPLALVGITDGSNAAPGQVGEVISVLVPNNTPVAFPADGGWYSIASVMLTPGDWDCHGGARININNLTPSLITQNMMGGLSLTNNTDPLEAVYFMQLAVVNMPANAGMVLMSAGVPPMRMNITVPTPVYLTVRAVIGAGQTVQGSGTIYARRMR